MKPAHKLSTFLQNTWFFYDSLIVLIFFLIFLAAQTIGFWKLSNKLAATEVTLETIASDISAIQTKTADLEAKVEELKAQSKEIHYYHYTEDEDGYHIVSKANTNDVLAMVRTIAPAYDISPYMVMAMIERESGYNHLAVNGEYKGLLQISERWHKSRMESLGVTDLFDPESNIKVACAYLKDLYDLHADDALVLMCYSMNNDKAIELHKKGEMSVYATAVLERMKELEEEYGE